MSVTDIWYIHWHVLNNQVCPIFNFQIYATLQYIAPDRQRQPTRSDGATKPGADPKPIRQPESVAFRTQRDVNAIMINLPR